MNVLMWSDSGPLDPNQCPHWNSKEFLDLHWLSTSIENQLKQHGIADYLIIITEFSNHNLLDYIATFNEKNIIIIQADHLHHSNLLRQVIFHSDNSYTVPFLISDTITNFVKVATSNPSKNIVFYSLVANLDRETSQVTLPNNLLIKHLSIGNLFHKTCEYINSTPVSKKNPNAKTFICLNNANRPHRTALVAYLISKELDGYISCINWDTDPTVGCFLDWCFGEVHLSIADSINDGITKFKHTKLLDLPCVGNPVENYNSVLSTIFHDTYVEIISDTTFLEPSAFLNDKYVNNILGANFPIFVSSSGTVDQLRQLGFDMFDDVIDHSYDTITDHALRLANAVDLNIRLLTDNEYTKQLWYKHQDRFIKNQQYFNNEFKQQCATWVIPILASGVYELYKKLK